MAVDDSLTAGARQLARYVLKEGDVPGDVLADQARIVLALLQEGDAARIVRVNGSDRQSWRDAARALGPGTYWHEPDNHGVTAEVHGTLLDNAGFWGTTDTAMMPYEELHVVLSKDGEPRYAVNLADLLGWAAQDGGQGGGS